MSDESPKEGRRAAAQSEPQPQIGQSLSSDEALDFIENGVVPMHSVSVNGRLLWANRAELKLLGYDWDEYIGHHVSEFHADQEKIDEIISRLAKGEALRDFESRMRRKDGKILHVAISASVVERDGKVQRSRVFTREISKQRALEIDLRSRAYQLERALNQNETLLAQLECLLGGAPSGIAFLDYKLRYLRVNAAMAALHGAPVEAHVGRLPREVLRAGGEDLEEVYARVLRTGKSEISMFDSSIWGQDPPRRLVCSYYPVVAPDGEKLGLGVIAVDVTERSLALDAMHEAQQRLKNVVDNAPIIVGAVDKTGKFLFVEGAGLQTFGIDGSKLFGVSAFERFGSTPETNALKRALAGETNSVAAQFNGSWFEITLMPMKDKHGEITGAFGVALDITRRRQAEARQHELESSLEQARRMESLRVMAGGIGHDLNNLLTAVLGNANLALMRMPASAPARHNIEQIDAAARHASELTREMLACAGRSQASLKPLDLNRFADSVSGLLEISLGGRIMVRQEFAPMLPAIYGDSAQLGRLLMNLLNNAAEAIGNQSGTIDLSTGTIEATREYLATCAGGEKLAAGTYVYLDVIDDGCGMDEETRKKIFEPFFSTKSRGGGLSLAAALGILRSHGGAIHVQSAPGKGSTFRLLFPATDAPVPPPDTKQVQPPLAPLAAGQSVLVVDDDESVRQVAKMMLEELRVKSILAENGLHALELFRERKKEIALVILDLTMPGLSGEETLIELRKLDPDLRVVISTGYTEREVAMRLSDRKLSGFLPKPYGPSQIRDILIQALASGK